MKKQAAAVAMGALLTLVMTAPSFAQSGGHTKHHPRANAAQPNPNYYNSTTGSNGNDSDGGYGGLSGAIGGIGH